MRLTHRPLLLIALFAAALLLPGYGWAQIGGASILLVASAQMKDPRFARTVVLVTRHGRSPPLGVIINRPLETPLGSALPELPANEAGRPLFVGGPLSPTTLVFLFRSPTGSADAISVANDIHLGRSGAVLTELLNGQRQHTGLRVFAGYSGWANGQLEKEIQRRDWHVLPLDRDLLFDKDVTLIWPELIRRASQQSIGARPFQSFQLPPSSALPFSL